MSVNFITLASNWHSPCLIVEQTGQRISGGGTRNNNSRIDEEEREGGDRRQTDGVRNP